MALQKFRRAAQSITLEIPGLFNQPCQPCAYRQSTLYDLGKVMNGDIHKIIEELKLAENAEKLKESGEVL